MLTAALLVAAWKFIAYQRHKGTVQYYVYFENILGLQPSAKVMIQGVPVGRIEELSLDDPYKVKLTLRIKDEVKLWEGSHASLANDGINGEKQVDLWVGDGDALIEPGSILGSKLDSNLLPLDHRISPILETSRFLLASSEAGLRGFLYALNSGLIRGTARGLLDIEDQLLDLEAKIEEAGSSTDRFTQSMRSSLSSLVQVQEELRQEPFERAAAITEGLAEAAASLPTGNALSSLDAANPSQVLSKPLIDPRSYQSLVNRIQALHAEIKALKLEETDSVD